MIKTDS